MQVQGHVAMITGGGSGIGRATALMLAREGADVLIADINGDAAEKVAGEGAALGRRSLGVKTDTTVKSEVQRAVAQGIERLGKIDILLNAAGIGMRTPVRQLDEDVWDHVIAVHLKSMFLCSQAVIDSMIQNGWGRIVNITSRAAYKGRTGTGPYAAAKGGMLAFSRVLANELGEHGITVNNVAPGTTVTPMVEQGFGGAEAQAQEAIDSGVILNPVRLARADEMARAVLYFCGPDSDHTTGATLHVNGGTFIA